MDHHASYDENTWTDVGDLLSEESDFYGNVDTKAELKKRAAAYNPKEYWDIAGWNIQRQAALSAQHLPQGTKRKRTDPSDRPLQPMANPRDGKKSSSVRQDNESRSKKLYSPYEGDQCAKQLSETVEDFLLRLVPSRTNTASVGPWIWVANPYSEYRPTNENIGAFKQEGSAALAEYLSQKSKIENENPNKAQASITRLLKPARDDLEVHIIDLAKKHGVSSGKWMLFPSPEDVDIVWAHVARAVLNNELGCSAKVETDDGDPNRKRRLVCIYTMNFLDIKDVKRVLDRMRDLGLVRDSKDKIQTIYYKCDAYTHLDIANGNEYKLKASMYSSRDIPSEMST